MTPTPIPFDISNLGMIDIVSIIQQFVNVKAVLLAFVVTKLLTYILNKFCPDKIASGSILSRLLPLFPLALGGLFCGVIERDSHFVFEDVFRGLMSGMMAAYWYRAVKVSFFGE